MTRSQFAPWGKRLAWLALVALSAYYLLVWLRLMYQFQEWLFFYVKDEALRDATREWASWVVPLLVIELAVSWLPLLRSAALRPVAAGR